MRFIEDVVVTTKELEVGRYYKKCEIIIDSNEVKIYGCSFENCTFTFELQEKLDIQSCVMKSCDLSLHLIENSYLSNVVFNQCKLMSFSFYKCVLKNITITDSMCNYMSISDTKIIDSSIINSSCLNSSLMRLNHKNLVFEKSNIDGTNFEDTKMKDIDLRTCEFDYILYSQHLLSGLKIRSDQAISFAVQLGIDVDV